MVPSEVATPRSTPAPKRKTFKSNVIMGDIDKVRFNAVQMDRIFIEAVTREKASSSLSTQFCLNPATLRYVTPKPVSVDPVAMSRASRAQISSPLLQTGMTLAASSSSSGRPGTQSDPSFITEDVLSLMHMSQRPPKVKYLEPVLSSHAVGWNLEHAKLWQRRSEKWRRPKATCDVTQYATAYYTLNGTTPFSKPIEQTG